MPYIKCPECNQRRLAKLPGNHSLESWIKLHGSDDAAVTCVDANLYNDCVRAHEDKARAEKQKKIDEERLAKREVSLTIAEAKSAVEALSTFAASTDGHGQLVDKLQKFLNGDDTYLVVNED